ncbi:MAG TPA: dTDP-4-dehydrorhamnose reductase [Lichenihabitans sp.]|nr:dTDP-4-dehydrorhamnose reductase [Lichenihabitans sp.]
MRLAVTGKSGQVVRTLCGLAPNRGVEVVTLGRPGLDLADPASIAPALRQARADIVVNAAAYTAVDKAESEPDLAQAINAAGAGAVAKAARELGLPVIQISTDYVFDGAKTTPYREDDSAGPLGVYGCSKLGGERAVARENPWHAILRTAWVYAPYGNNFVRTMLRLASTRPEVGVVADQRGCPTAAEDVAETILTVARRLQSEPGNAALRGVFHVAAQGEAVWADVAEAIFATSARLGGPSASVERITTADYPTPARRPANSRLDCTKLRDVYGITLPAWRQSLDACVARLVAELKAGA